MTILKHTRTVQQCDVMDGSDRWEYVGATYGGSDGRLALVDVMPRYAPEGYGAEHRVVQAARTSFGDGLKSIAEDRALIRYLLRNKHTTPFEFVKFTFHVVLPIFVARQWMRHRTGAFNEMSARYVPLDIGNYVPEWRSPPAVGHTKQGSGDSVAADQSEKLDAVCQTAYAASETAYAALLRNAAKEQARVVLPVGAYTQFYWTVDLHNLLHFLELRLDAHAQAEIRAYAVGLMALITPLVPWTVQAFEDYRLRTVTFSASEVSLLQLGYQPTDRDVTTTAEFKALSKTEQASFLKKLAVLRRPKY